MRLRKRMLGFALGAIPLALAGMASASAAPSAGGRTPLAGTAFPFGSISVDGGPADPQEVTTARLWLSVRDPGELAQAAKQASDPHSPDYAHYDSAAQVGAHNELDPGQLATIDDWLRSAGLQVSHPDWRYLDVTGTLGQFGQAFDVTYDKFTPTYDGSVVATGVGATTDLSVPAAVGNLVLGEEGADSIYVVTSSAADDQIDGAVGSYAKSRSVDALADGKLDNAASAAASAAPGAKANSTADDSQCSQYWGQRPATGLPTVDGKVVPYAVCGYTPAQLRSAYGLDTSPLSGKGQTIAEALPASTSLEQDVNTWSAHVGTQPLRPGQLTVIGSPDGSGPPIPDSDLEGIESTLDVEAMHGIAPDADIVDIGEDTENWASVVDTYAYIEDHDLASIVNTSAAIFESPGMTAVYDQVFQEGALQGIGFYFSTGDTGNYAWPASSSWATGVGGTALAIGANGQRLWETGWGDEQASLSADQSTWGALGPSNGAGGGNNPGQPQPWYQRGVVPASLAAGADGTLDRAGADVAMDADGRTGMLAGGKPLDVTGDGAAYVETRIGGTSLSSPLFAGVQALAQQAAGHRLGFANPEIYQRYDTPSFRDITKYTLPDGSYPTEAAQPLFTDVWDLYVHQGQVPVSTIVSTPPDTLPGFDEVTGVGAPTGAYLRSFH